MWRNDWKPYIGITDFTTADETQEMFRVFQEAGGPAIGRVLQAGVMTSKKVLTDQPTKWAKAFPPKEKLREIFLHHDHLLGTLHYADYEDAPELEQDLERAFGHAYFGFAGQPGAYCMQAIQLDMIWPDPAKLLRVSEWYGNIRIILQVGKEALSQVGNDPEKLLKRLEPYKRCVDDVLLDKSAGKGLGLDAEGLRPFVEAVLKRGPGMGVVVAGGLGPESLHLVEALVRDYPMLSIDAQGKLRPSGDALNEPISWTMAERYLRKAVEMFRTAQDGSYRTFHTPHPGFQGAAIPIPEPVRKVAAALAGKRLWVPEALAKLRAVTDGKVEDHPDHGWISLHLGRPGGPEHVFRVIRYR
ncbi:MAG TPA: hypothetical protein VL283_00330 [Candidatus Baltobacteraceae bacterium]|nr:hypothetical protein [Candidatus Baltobacteraceae bacterium]